jgi:hypothetical protein
MSTKKKLSESRVENDNDSGVVRAYWNGSEVENFQTRRPNKVDNTIELSPDGKIWERVQWVHIGKAKFDDNYNPEFDPNEYGKDIMVSPTAFQVKKGNM